MGEDLPRDENLCRHPDRTDELRCGIDGELSRRRIPDQAERTDEQPRQAGQPARTADEQIGKVDSLLGLFVHPEVLSQVELFCRMTLDASVTESSGLLTTTGRRCAPLSSKNRPSGQTSTASLIGR